MVLFPSSDALSARDCITSCGARVTIWIIQYILEAFLHMKEIPGLWLVLVLASVLDP